PLPPVAFSPEIHGDETICVGTGAAPMFKLIVTCRKKAGMPFSEFVDYYENKHLPLARALFPPLAVHRRNYILTDHPFYGFLGMDRLPEGELPFDVVTEIF